MKPIRTLLILACTLPAGCAAFSPKMLPGGTPEIPVQGCYVWPPEGEDAYAEITKACGGTNLPNCPKQKAWRSQLRNLKGQLTLCGSDQL